VPAGILALRFKKRKARKIVEEEEVVIMKIGKKICYKANTGGQKIYLKATLCSLHTPKKKNSMQTPDLFLKRKIKKCCLINFLIS